MGLIRPKLTAYLIDRAINVNIHEISKVFKEKPLFAEAEVGPIERLTPLTKDTLKMVCKLFWHDTNENWMLRSGFMGTGVEPIKHPRFEYRILLYGNREACQILEKKIGYLISYCKEFDIQTFEIEEIAFASGDDNCICGGCQIGPSMRRCLGTFGGWFKRAYEPPKEQRKFVGITNHHVFSDLQTCCKGSNVVNTQGVKIGEVEASNPLVPYSPLSNDYNLVDVAFIRPDQSVLISQTIPCISDIIKDASKVERLLLTGNTDVILCNNNSGKKGQITQILPTFYIQHRGHQYGFQDVIQINIGSHGDSGSLILDSDENICGLFFAVTTTRGQSYGYANKWEFVNKAAKFNFVYG